SRSSHPLSLWYPAEGGGATFSSGHEGAIVSVGVTPDGNFAISGSDDNTIKIWDLNTLRLVRSLEAYSDGIAAIALSRDGRLLASRSWDSTLRIWECDRWEELTSLGLRCNYAPSALAFHPEELRLAVADESDHSIKIFELDYDHLRSRARTGLEKPVQYSNAKVVLVG